VRGDQSVAQSVRQRAPGFGPGEQPVVTDLPRVDPDAGTLGREHAPCAVRLHSDFVQWHRWDLRIVGGLAQDGHGVGVRLDHPRGGQITDGQRSERPPSLPGGTGSGLRQPLTDPDGQPNRPVRPTVDRRRGRCQLPFHGRVDRFREVRDRGE